MSYTPTNWSNKKAPGISDKNLNKIEQELKKLDDIVSVPDITETTDTTMQNSYDGRLLVDEIGGVCQQGANPSPTSPQEVKCVKGKNLLKNTATSWTNNGITYTVNPDGTIVANGTATAESHIQIANNVDLIGEKVVLSGCPSGGAFGTYRIQVNGHTGASSFDVDTGTGVTISPTRVIDYVTIYITNGVTVSNLVFKPMIRKASIADDTYVPYGLLRVKTHGKNLLNINKEPYLANYMVNGTYGFYATESCDVYRINNLKSGKIYFKIGITEENISVGLYRNDGTLYYAWKYANRNSFYIDNNYSADYMLVTVKKGDNAFMVSYEDIPYEPYVESSFTFSKPIDLYGIGDVQDVITQKQIKRRFAKTVIDGSVAPESVTSGNYGGTIVSFQYNAIGMSLVKERSLNRLCDTLQPPTTNHPTSYKNLDIGHWGFNTSGAPDSWFMFCVDETFTTPAQAQTWLTTHPITIVFELAEEITEDLPLADQIALNSLATYEGTTYLEFDAEVQPTFEGEYGTSKVGGYTLEALLTARSK